MKRVNWKSVQKSSQLLKRNIKNIQAASEYLSNIPGEGYFIDNISKREVKISECKSSSLRRYVKSLENYYYLIGSSADKKRILDKKIEIENELNKRDDATGVSEKFE